MSKTSVARLPVIPTLPPEFIPAGGGGRSAASGPRSSLRRGDDSPSEARPG
jgi:hypothetical protein